MTDKTIEGYEPTYTQDHLGIRLQKAAEKHCEGVDLPHDLGLRLVSEVFRSDGKEEDRWCEAVENACPACAGSGHKDDARANLKTRDQAMIAEGMRQAAAIAEQWNGGFDIADDIRAEAKRMERGEG